MGHALLKSGCLGEGICVSLYCTILQLPAHSRLLILLNIIIYLYLLHPIGMQIRTSMEALQTKQKSAALPYGRGDGDDWVTWQYSAINVGEIQQAL